MKTGRALSCLFAVLATVGTGLPQSALAETGAAKPATPVTQAANAAVEAELPFGNQTDFELAQKNLIAKPDSVVIKDSTGRVEKNPNAELILSDSTRRPETGNSITWRKE